MYTLYTIHIFIFICCKYYVKNTFYLRLTVIKQKRFRGVGFESVIRSLFFLFTIYHYTNELLNGKILRI